MARDAFQELARRKDAQNVEENLAQIESACQTIKAIALRLQAIRAAWAAGVASGAFDKADVDQLDALTPKVAALYSAVNTYLG